MLKSFQVIKDTIDYRIINLLNQTRLSEFELAEILNLPIDKIRSHLNVLQEMRFVSCDYYGCQNTWRISDIFIETNPLFYEMAIIQMQKTPLYQNDLVILEEMKQNLSTSY